MPQQALLHSRSHRKGRQRAFPFVRVREQSPPSLPPGFLTQRSPHRGHSYTPSVFIYMLLIGKLLIIILIELKMSLLTAGGLDQMAFKGPFQPKPFSTILRNVLKQDEEGCSASTTKLHPRKDTAHQLKVFLRSREEQPEPSACITGPCSKARAHKDTVLKLPCGQESLQQSKQLCCSLLHTPSAAWLEACLLPEAQKPRSQGCGMTDSIPTEGKQHPRLGKDSTLPSPARPGAVPLAQRPAGTGDTQGLSQWQNHSLREH